MKILCIGDIAGRIGRDQVFSYLDRHAQEYDCILANAENAAHGRGLSKAVYTELKQAGIHGFTLGNHTWGCPDLSNVLKYESDIIRPANFSEKTPGSGSMLLTVGDFKIGVINLIGRTYMLPADCPFAAADRELEKLKDKTNIIFVDFHAEATSEKIAMGYYLDGRVSAVFGTHTHVQTADEQILPNGTGFITDLGMTGPIQSVLGIRPELAIEKMHGKLPVRFAVAEGPCRMDAVVLTVDPATGKTTAIERIGIE